VRNAAVLGGPRKAGRRSCGPIWKSTSKYICTFISSAGRHSPGPQLVSLQESVPHLTKPAAFRAAVTTEGSHGTDCSRDCGLACGLDHAPGPWVATSPGVEQMILANTLLQEQYRVTEPLPLSQGSHKPPSLGRQREQVYEGETATAGSMALPLTVLLSSDKSL
jgi:hypothetical protein